MISWLQGTFQHHFKMVFAVLLAVTIVSFIMTIGATPGIGRGERRDVKRDFFGYNLASQEDMGRMMADAGLSVELQVGSGGIDPEQVKTYALQRVASLYLASAWRIPAATPGQVTAFIKGLRIFAGPDGQFDASRYNGFRDSLRSNSRANEADIVRVIGDDVRAHEVQELLDGPGYVLPADVKSQLLRADTSWTIATATVDYAGFAPAINPSDAELEKYYKDNAFRYKVPPRILASYVDFPASRTLGEVKLADGEVRSYYQANPERFPAPAKDAAAGAPAVKAPETPAQAAPAAGKAVAPAAAGPDADFAAVRPQVEAALKLDRAKQLAAKAASDLAFALYESKVQGGAALDAFLAARKAVVKPLAPFAAEAGPAELGSSADMTDAVSKLDAQRFFSEAVTTPSGAAILLWKGSLPASQPALAEVRENVKADYADAEKRKRFVELGKSLRDKIGASMKSGDSFEKAAAAAAAAQSVKVETKTLPASTLRDRPKELNPAEAGALERLDKGQVSEMIADADKGYLVCALDRKAPDLTDTNPHFAQMREAIAGTMARLGSGSYLNEIVAQELKRTESVVK